MALNQKLQRGVPLAQRQDMIKFLLSHKELDLSLPNKLGHLSFEAYAETYGNDELANMVE